MNDIVTAMLPSEVQTVPGKTVEIPVMLSHGGSLSFDFMVKYDPEVFEPISVAKGERATGPVWVPDENNEDAELVNGSWSCFGHVNGDGRYAVTLWQNGMTGFASGGEAAVLTFKVADDAKPGFYNISFIYAAANEQPCSCIAGYIRIK